MSKREWDAYCKAILRGPQVCDCCRRLVPKVRGSVWHGKSRICGACFYIWYDGSHEDSTDPEKVAASVLAAEAAGAYPFGDSDADFRRVS
jgi:hypothetical protein